MSPTSEYHRTKAWKTFARRVRPQIAASLPAPCVDCRRMVHPTDAWEIGHLGFVALDPDQPLSIEMVGPSHRHCNRSAGGRLGAAMSNRGRPKPTARMPKW